MGISKRGDSYIVQFFYEKKRYRWTSPTKKEAEKLLLDVKVAIRNGEFEKRYLNGNIGKMPYPEAVEWYDKTHIVIDIPNEKNRDFMRYVLGLFGTITGCKLIQDYSVRDIEKYKVERIQTVKPISVNRELGIISGMFSLLEKHEMIERNPIASKVYYYETDAKRSRFASSEELKLIFGAIGSVEMKMIVLTAVMTGMRLSNICGLEVKNFDFDENIIRFKQVKVSKQNVIPMNTFFTEAVKKYIEKQSISSKLFTLDSPKVSNIWRGLMQSLGIENLRFHDLRHTFATMLYAQSGTDIKLVSEMLGHSRIDMTSSVYTHTQIERKREIVDGLKLDFFEL